MSSASGTIVLKRPLPGATNSPITKKNKTAHALQPPSYFGCEHLGTLFKNSGSPDAGKNAKSYYRQVLRMVFDASTQTKPLACSKLCPIGLTRTVLCLQCPFTHCVDCADGHASESGHSFGVDSRTGHVYCFMCRDYIYDPTMLKIRLEMEAAVDCGDLRRKARAVDMNPVPEDLSYIKSNSNLPPCRATGLRGILNLGSTCFMSVVLQSALHCPLLRNFYMSDGHKRGEDCKHHPNCMSCCMDEIFCEFFVSDKTDGYGPVNVLSTSWACAQNTLAGYQQQDAHEYLQFLLNQLHITNRGQAEENKDSCECIIHRAFYGTLQSDVTCQGCNTVSSKQEPVMDLSLELRAKDKKRIDTPTPQTLEECLERFTGMEKLGTDQYKCGTCKGPREASKQLTVSSLPPVLCIQLKRFEHIAAGSQKIETKIRFPMSLDMVPYLTRTKRKSPEKPPKAVIYDLTSVVVHKGNVDSGHYINYAREVGQWFQFDDSMVTLASEKQVLGAQAYLLFYLVRNL